MHKKHKKILCEIHGTVREDFYKFMTPAQFVKAYKGADGLLRSGVDKAAEMLAGSQAPLDADASLPSGGQVSSEDEVCM